jgi:hypothetical protein
MPDKENEGGSPPRNATDVPSSGVKRPLVPIVLALMLGLLGAAWGLKVSGVWLVAGLAGLFAVMVLLYVFNFFRGSQGKDGEQHNEPTGKNHPGSKKKA